MCSTVRSKHRAELTGCVVAAAALVAATAAITAAAAIQPKATAAELHPGGQLRTQPRQTSLRADRA